MSAKPDFARHSLGILCYLIGVAFFALNDALGKHLVGDYSVAQLLFVRGIGAVAVLVPIMLAMRVRFRRRAPAARRRPMRPSMICASGWTCCSPAAPTCRGRSPRRRRVSTIRCATSRIAWNRPGRG